MIKHTYGRISNIYGNEKNWDFESETEHIVVVFQMKLGTMNEIQS